MDKPVDSVDKVMKLTRSPFAMLPIWVYEHRAVTPTVLGVYLSLVTASSKETRRTHRSIPEIMAQTGFKKSAVYAAIATLREIGAVVNRRDGSLFLPLDEPDSDSTTVENSAQVETAFHPDGKNSTTVEKNSTTVESPLLSISSINNPIEPPLPPRKTEDGETQSCLELVAVPATGQEEAKDDVQTVFDAWVRSKGTRGALTAERRKLINARLRDFAVEDLVDAVQGWQHSPHHRGENDSGTVYNDLALLLRDGDRIEKFRDLHRGQRPQGLVKGSSPGQRTLQNLAAFRAKQAQKEIEA